MKNQAAIAKWNEEIGKTYGRLTILSIESQPQFKRPTAHCQCECGSKWTADLNRLRSGGTKSCGCYQRQRAGDRHHAKWRELIGKRFERLVIKHIEAGGKDQKAVCTVRCDCGTVSMKKLQLVLKGSTRSCGCLQAEYRRLLPMVMYANYPEQPYVDPVPDHPAVGNDRRYWLELHGHLMDRCYNREHVSFRHYGGRGIGVYEPWRTDRKECLVWILDNLGSRPSPKHSLDRIDNNRGYEPGNLRWATRSRQARNMRKSLTVTIGDRSQNINDWCEELRVPRYKLKAWLKQGFDEPTILTSAAAYRALGKPFKVRTA